MVATIPQRLLSGAELQHQHKEQTMNNRATEKRYRCTKCGYETTHKTNHYGKTYSWGRFHTCANCPPHAKYPEYGGATVWECIDKPPTHKDNDNEQPH